MISIYANSLGSDQPNHSRFMHEGNLLHAGCRVGRDMTRRSCDKAEDIEGQEMLLTTATIPISVAHVAKSPFRTGRLHDEVVKICANIAAFLRNNQSTIIHCNHFVNGSVQAVQSWRTFVQTYLGRISPGGAKRSELNDSLLFRSTWSVLLLQGTVVEWIVSRQLWLLSDLCLHA